MSKPGIILSIAILWLLSSPLFGRENDTAEDLLLNAAYADRIIMVGFRDQHIGRIQTNASAFGYRRRGSYQSSSWSQRITSELAEKYGLVKLTEWPMTEIGVHCAVYLLPVGLSANSAIQLMSQEEEIEIVQKLHRYKTEGHRYNDPYYQLQSNMHSMEIESAHGRSTGKNIAIAVIDTGVDMEHPDLAGQIELNKNFVSAISKGFSDDMHGTAVTGVIAARKDNKTGIIGVAPDAKIIALKACWPDQSGSFEASCNSFSLALAVNTAIKLGAKILNLSLSGPEDPLLAQLINKAQQKGMIVVAADPGEKYPQNRFPASLKGVIPVQSLDDVDTHHSFENGSLKAPGKHILTTLPYGTYDFISGSSLSAAQVSGLVALMLELTPDLNAEQTQAILQKSIQLQEDDKKHDRIANLNAGKMIQMLCKDNRCR